MLDIDDRSTPKNFRELVLADLRRAARLIVKVQDEIDLQFRMATPKGDYALAVTLPSDSDERTAMLERISTFMAWKQVRGFTIASELYEPDCVCCAGITADERIICMSRITRRPRPWSAVNFSAAEWLPETSIDPLLIDLLPAAARPMTPKEISALQRWFGIDGKFPAVHLPSGEVQGL